MLHYFRVLLAILLLALSIPCSHAAFRKHKQHKIKSSVFLSPTFELDHGSVVDTYYYNIDFPRGHIALKGFNAEVVDEEGHPVPLHETYLHHLGPYPYGIEIGNPAEVPAGYEERWFLNVHAIDTRGVEDKLGCTECRCDLYNVSNDEYGRPLEPDYIGGLKCCYDHAQCKVREVSKGAKRNLYMKYTVKWINWDESIVPVKIFILDVTDNWNGLDNSTVQSAERKCHVEYQIEPCSASGMADNGCIHTKRTSLTFPTGGYLIYGVAHQHSGGIGSTLYGEDGRVLCSSIPAYGQGKEAGNEAGYIVGMSTCYPQPGSVKINDGETLILESKYSSAQRHTGVMGLFYILVADQLPKPVLSLRSPIAKSINQGSD
uniref:Stress up-regulated Nod 19 protein n=1 Tax=Fagus sylvatica TaxID=28930 RepID=A0A2N9FP59_FAGSY